MTDEKKPPTGYAIAHGQERPPLPATVQVEKAPAWAISMQERIVAKQDANHDIVMNEMGRLSSRIDELETWRKTGQNRSYSGPQKTTSGEVRRISENDLSQDKAIAALLEKQAATDAKVDSLIKSQGNQTAMQVEIKTAVTGFMKQHPEISNGIATLLGVIIALVTAWFNSKVHP